MWKEIAIAIIIIVTIALIVAWIKSAGSSPSPANYSPSPAPQNNHTVPRAPPHRNPLHTPVAQGNAPTQDALARAEMLRNLHTLVDAFAPFMEVDQHTDWVGPFGLGQDIPPELMDFIPAVTRAQGRWQTFDFRPATAPATRQPVAFEEVAARNATRADAVSDYMNTVVTHENSAQNVHDVNADLLEIYGILKITNQPIDVPMTLHEIQQFAGITVGDNARRARVFKCVDEIATRAGRIDILDDTEDHILALVWARATHVGNAQNEKKIREAVIDALDSAVEHGNVVCIGGCVTRMIGALTLLDFDPRVARGLMTTEMYRNQVFKESADIITSIIANMKESDDDTIRAAAHKYDAGEQNDQSTEENIRNTIIAALDRNIDRYTGKFSQNELVRLRRDCYAAV